MPQDLITGDEIDGQLGVTAEPAATPKQALSEEQLAIRRAKHREYNQKHRAQSRGRPASKAAPSAMPRERAANAQTDQSLEDDTDYAALAGTLTRESRLNGDNTFDIPMAGRVAGWDYCYWPTHLVGEPIDASQVVEYQRGGWIPVPAKHFPQLCPTGYDRRTIDRKGQRMYMRPMKLTLEAQAEQYNMSKAVLQQKLAQAQAGDTGRDFAARDPRATGLQMELKPLLD